jgi:hypothetical protein
MSQQLQLQLYQITAYAEELAQVGTTPYPLYAVTLFTSLFQCSKATRNSTTIATRNVQEQGNRFSIYSKFNNRGQSRD